MDYRLTDAYTYFFKSDNWFSKIIFLTLLNIPMVGFIFVVENENLVYTNSELFLLFFCTIVGATIAFGYCARCTQNLIYLKNDNLNVLPDWNNRLTDYLLLGLKKAWFYTKAGFVMFPMMFVPKNFFVTDMGLDLAIEGVFCQHFDQSETVDYSSILASVRGNFGFYYKMAFMTSLVPISFILLIPLFLLLHIKLGVFLALAPFVVTHYILVSAYFSAISAKYMGFDSAKK